MQIIIKIKLNLQNMSKLWIFYRTADPQLIVWRYLKWKDIKTLLQFQQVAEKLLLQEDILLSIPLTVFLLTHPSPLY